MVRVIVHCAPTIHYSMEKLKIWWCLWRREIFIWYASTKHCTTIGSNCWLSISPTERKFLEFWHIPRSPAFREFVLEKIVYFELPHDKTNKIMFAPSEDSDQPGHPLSLIRVFAVRMKKPWILSYPLSTQQRLWSECADAQADLSLCWIVHVILLVLSCGSSFDSFGT